MILTKYALYVFAQIYRCHGVILLHLLRVSLIFISRYKVILPMKQKLLVSV